MGRALICKTTVGQKFKNVSIWYFQILWEFNFRSYLTLLCATKQYSKAIWYCFRLAFIIPTALPYATLYYLALPCAILRCLTLPCATLRYPTLLCTTLRCLALPCATLRYIALPFSFLRFIATSLYLPLPHISSRYPTS